MGGFGRTLRVAGLMVLALAVGACGAGGAGPASTAPPGATSAGAASPTSQPLGDVVDVAVDGQACAVRRDGSVVCWGGLPTRRQPETVSVPRVRTGVSGASDVAVSPDHACAIVSGGRVTCWGLNADGEVGREPDNPLFEPEPVAGVAGATSVVAVSGQTCALTEGRVLCWGATEWDRWGAGGELRPSSGDGTPRAVAGLADARAIALGMGFGCALTGDAAVWCWGSDEQGTLGTAARSTGGAPVRVDALTGASAVAAWGDTACALDRVGDAWCWGVIAAAAPDQAVPQVSHRPVRIPGVHGATSLAVGADHGCAAGAGLVSCWGLFGDVSDAAWTRSADSATAAQRVLAIDGLPPVDRLAAGGRTTCALTTQAQVWCWGADAHGVLGPEAIAAQPIARDVPGVTSARRVVTGDGFACALLTDASVRCWGANEAGQLGDGTRRSRWVPAAVPGLTDVRALAAAESWACAVVGAGQVRCWGTRAADTLGADLGGAAAGPTVVPGISDAATVDIAHGQACATTQAGGVRCWGYGGGLNADTDATLRPGLRDAVEVASGGYFGPPCIRTSSGRVVCEAESASASTAGPTPLLSRDAVLGVDPSTMTCVVPDGGALSCRIPFTGPDGSKHVEHIAGAAIRLLAPPLPPSASSAGVNATATATATPGTPSPLRQVAAGESTVCAVLASTDLRCWGELRPHGQSVWEARGVASSAPDHPQRPAAVPGIAQATWVAVAADHACAVRPGGAVACWGSNAGGVFGVNPGWVPVAIPAPRA